MPFSRSMIASWRVRSSPAAKKMVALTRMQSERRMTAEPRERMRCTAPANTPSSRGSSAPGPGVVARRSCRRSTRQRLCALPRGGRGWTRWRSGSGSGGMRWPGWVRGSPRRFNGAPRVPARPAGPPGLPHVVRVHVGESTLVPGRHKAAVPADVIELVELREVEEQHGGVLELEEIEEGARRLPRSPGGGADGREDIAEVPPREERHVATCEVGVLHAAPVVQELLAGEFDLHHRLRGVDEIPVE